MEVIVKIPRLAVKGWKFPKPVLTLAGIGLFYRRLNRIPTFFIQLPRDVHLEGNLYWIMWEMVPSRESGDRLSNLTKMKFVEAMSFVAEIMSRTGSFLLAKRLRIDHANVVKEKGVMENDIVLTNEKIAGLELENKTIETVLSGKVSDLEMQNGTLSSRIDEPESGPLGHGKQLLNWKKRLFNKHVDLIWVLLFGLSIDNEKLSFYDPIRLRRMKETYDDLMGGDDLSDLGFLVASVLNLRVFVALPDDFVGSSAS
ncbi:hypothetical protein L2E82_18484 [Cichorium intybus]|uniref:Uncharacterized protein n=1 Tax=Cichorium intybus TaxID=13427 RepID=A0ACB9F9L4_CICIN|nr:hypothetical protein L2E82_18484 [Cichorium intybus]